MENDPKYDLKEVTDEKGNQMSPMLPQETKNYLIDIDGTICTIYDWKCGSTPKDEYDWHIGGHNSKALKALEQALNHPVVAWTY